MAQKEIETVKKAEKQALDIIANAQKEAETILKSAKATQETTKKQEISRFREEMKKKRDEAEITIVSEADSIKAQGKKEAEKPRDNIACGARKASLIAPARGNSYSIVCTERRADQGVHGKSHIV